MAEPGARLLWTRPLSGGISATMTAFEVERLDGQRQKRIARQPNREGAAPAAEEFQTLTVLKAASLPVPTPVALVPASEAFPNPFLVVEYIEGRPEVDPQDVPGYVDRYAAQLAQIHDVDLKALDLSFLPPQGRGYGPSPEVTNDSLREGEIRDALEAYGEIARPNPPILRHGDFWPGNVLWQDGEIAGVIDWEEAHVGEPLADLAICRLDLWWVLGEDAAHEFTQRYRTRRNVDLRDLPYWDLCASLRPVPNIHEWAPAYPLLGRSDITEATMQRDHLAFTAQALEKI